MGTTSALPMATMTSTTIISRSVKANSPRGPCGARAPPALRVQRPRGSAARPGRTPARLPPLGASRLRPPTRCGAQSPGVAFPAGDVAVVAVAPGPTVGAVGEEVVGASALARAAVVVGVIPRVPRDVLLEVRAAAAI